MLTITVSVAIGVATFGAGVGGLLLQKFLPEQHTTDRSRDMLAAVVGLISLLLALVLGTLVGSAYSFYATQKSEMETLAARSLQLDLSLGQYGPEAMPLRSALRSTLAGIDTVIWGDGHGNPNSSRLRRFFRVYGEWSSGSRLWPPTTTNRGSSSGRFAPTRHKFSRRAC